MTETHDSWLFYFYFLCDQDSNAEKSFRNSRHPLCGREPQCLDLAVRCCWVNLPFWGHSHRHRHWPVLPHLGFRCHLAFDPGPTLAWFQCVQKSFESGNLDLGFDFAILPGVSADAILQIRVLGLGAQVGENLTSFMAPPAQGVVLTVKCVLAYYGAQGEMKLLHVADVEPKEDGFGTSPCQNPGLISKMLRSVSKLQLSWCPRQWIQAMIWEMWIASILGQSRHIQTLLQGQYSSSHVFAQAVCNSEVLTWYHHTWRGIFGMRDLESVTRAGVASCWMHLSVVTLWRSAAFGATPAVWDVTKRLRTVWKDHLPGAAFFLFFADTQLAKIRAGANEDWPSNYQQVEAFMAYPWLHHLGSASQIFPNLLSKKLCHTLSNQVWATSLCNDGGEFGPLSVRSSASLCCVMSDLLCRAAIAAWHHMTPAFGSQLCGLECVTASTSRIHLQTLGAPTLQTDRTGRTKVSDILSFWRQRVRNSCPRLHSLQESECWWTSARGFQGVFQSVFLDPLGPKTSSLHGSIFYRLPGLIRFTMVYHLAFANNPGHCTHNHPHTITFNLVPIEWHQNQCVRPF